MIKNIKCPIVFDFRVLSKTILDKNSEVSDNQI